MTVPLDPLDELIADMIAETGVPDAAAERWAEKAIEIARAAAERSETDLSR